MSQTLGYGSCYYPGGKWAAEFLPCDPTANVSLCCPSGWTCMSDLLCVMTQPNTANNTYPIGTTYRGTCTNPLWDDQACGDFCTNDPVNNNDGLLIACGNNKFCCAPDFNQGLCNCNSDKGTFSVSSGVAQTIIGVAGLPTVVPSFTPASSNTPTTSSVAPPLATNAGASQEKLTDKMPFKVGLGVALGVVLCLLLIIGCTLLVRRRLRKKTRDTDRAAFNAAPRPESPPLVGKYIPQRLKPPGLSDGSGDTQNPPVETLEMNLYQAGMESAPRFRH